MFRFDLKNFWQQLQFLLVLQLSFKQYIKELRKTI